MKELIFLDTETTHVRPGDDAGEIIELAIVDLDGKTLFDRKILPRHIDTATEEALKINGYDADLWSNEGAVYFHQVADEVLKIIEGKLIVGQHITFDTEFLKYEFWRAGIDIHDISYHTIDIASIAFHCLVPTPLQRTSLYLVCEYFGISNEGAHGALVDAQRAREVFLKLQAMKPTPAIQWPMPTQKDRSLVRQFQRDYQKYTTVTKKASLLKRGDRFSYPGSFKIYQAQSDAVADDRIKGKVVIVVTDHGLRNGMRTRLDADLECEIHPPICQIEMKPYVFDGFGN